MVMNRTIERSFELLRLLKDSPNGLTLKEICELMNIPKTSGFDIVQSLYNIGMVERPSDDIKRYTIGIGLFVLGNSYLAKKSLYNVGNKFLKALAEKLNKTTFIGILSDDKVVYVQKYEPEVSVKTSCNVGSTADIYATSLGKSLLAFSPKEVQDRIIPNINFIKLQSNTIDNEEEFRKELELTYHRGYSIDNNENEEGIFCIGAPIFDSESNLIATVSASGLYNPAMNLDYESIELKKTALQISRELGYLGR